jgi:hypothetical protein
MGVCTHAPERRFPDSVLPGFWIGVCPRLSAGFLVTCWQGRNSVRSRATVPAEVLESQEGPGTGSCWPIPYWCWQLLLVLEVLARVRSASAGMTASQNPILDRGWPAVTISQVQAVVGNWASQGIVSKRQALPIVGQ